MQAKEAEHDELVEGYELKQGRIEREFDLQSLENKRISQQLSTVEAEKFSLEMQMQTKLEELTNKHFMEMKQANETCKDLEDTTK